MTCIATTTSTSSFVMPNGHISEGDTVIVYMSFNNLRPIVVKRGDMFHSRFGSIKHADLVGKQYGIQVQTNSGGRVHVLRPTPELWTLCLPHRTQIIYTPDISMLTLQLEIKPGSVVVESGTGSASLSHAFIRTIFPTGHLHTFEFHAGRADTARKEFESHGLSQNVTVYNRDACGEGFGLEDVADAVFLDLPSPWKAIASAKKALKKEGSLLKWYCYQFILFIFKGGRICSFSPCIEQVQKVAIELTQQGFVDIETVENLRRVLSVKKQVSTDYDFNKNKNDESEEANGNKKQKKSGKRKIKDGESSDSGDDEEDNGVLMHTAKPINIQPGHTGYLTFATLLNKEFSNVNN